MKTAKAEAEKGVADCKKECGEDTAKATDKDKVDAAKVAECVTKDCGEYIKCMDALE